MTAQQTNALVAQTATSNESINAFQASKPLRMHSVWLKYSPTRS